MKITRGHLNRKILFFGLLSFLGISLISTGFASWIMSSGADVENNGNVSVGTVTDGSLEFSEIVFSEGNSTIAFDAQANDTDGDIKWDGTNTESLSVTFTTTINPSNYVEDITIHINVPQTVLEAANAGYIVIPECCYTGEVTTGVYLVKDGVINKDLLATNGANETGIVAEVKLTSEDTYEITCTINCGWGEQFGFKNPSIYLDEVDGMKVEEKKAALVNFRKTIFGLALTPEKVEDKQEGVTYYTVEEIFAYNTPLPFVVELVATAK